MNKTLTIVCLTLLLSSTARANTDYDYFSDVLQLEQRWQRVSAKTIDKYLVYLGKKGLYRDLSPAAEQGMKNEIRQQLQQRLGWDEVGEEVVETIMSGCSNETLRDFAAAYEGKGTATARSAAREYLGCATAGIGKSTAIIKQVLRDAAPSFGDIAKKYRS